MEILSQMSKHIWFPEMKAMIFIIIWYRNGPDVELLIDLKTYYIVTMMTSSNGSIFRVTGHLRGEFPVTGEFPSQRPVTRGLMFSLICAWINGWVNNREAGDLRRHRAHYDITVMYFVELHIPY